MIVPGRWSTDGEGGGIAGQLKVKAHPDKGTMKIPAEEPSVYEYLRRVGGWYGTLQTQIDLDAKQGNLPWGGENMNNRYHHKKMAEWAKDHPNDGEVAWSDVASWDYQETVSSYFHVVGFLVAHGGRMMHNAYTRDTPKRYQGFINWNWDYVPSSAFGLGLGLE